MTAGTGPWSSQDPGAVLAWRVEDTLEYWRTRAQAPVRRPLEAVSDEALERLKHRATGQLMRAKADSAHTGPAADRRDHTRNWLKETKETPWQSRLHGHVSDDDLQTRISRAKEQLCTDDTINDPAATAKARWLAGSLEGESVARAHAGAGPGR